MQIVGRTWLSLVTWTCGSWSEGQHDLYFTVQWFCHILKTIWYFGSMNQYDQTFYLKINVGHCDLYSMVQWFCLTSWRLSDVWIILFGIMSQYDPKFYLKINISHCDLYFMALWFCIILKTIWCINIILWDEGSVWPDVSPQNKCRSDLYFMVQSLCLYLQDYLMHECHIFR